MKAWDAKQLTIETHQESSDVQLAQVYDKITEHIKKSSVMVIVHEELLNEAVVQQLQEDKFEVSFNSKINSPKYTIGWFSAKGD